MSLEKDGSVTLLIGTQTTGQGHDTSYSQIVADHLRLPPERVRMLQGDTDHIATGTGTGGSSSIPAGGNSVAVAAAKLAEQLKDDRRRRAGSSAARSRICRWRSARCRHRSRHFACRARRNGRMRPPRSCARPMRSRRKAPTYPNGTHVAEVEIDEATGATDIVNYVIVDDFGVSLNPLLLEGQVHGGTVQGIGQALMEDTVYDPDSGQLMTASLMDYALPRAERHAGIHIRDAQCAVQDQSARRQGRGRGGRHRFLPGGDERGDRRAVARLQHPPSRHAGDAGAHLGARFRKENGSLGCE